MRRALLLAAIAFLGAAGSARAQDHDVDVPAEGQVNPMYADMTVYLSDSTYDAWWHEVAACEGFELPQVYLMVRWVEVNYPYFDLPKDEPATKGEVILGHSFVREWQIYIAAPYRRDEEVIKHEMAHFILFWQRIGGGHPLPYFDGHCGFGEKYGNRLHKAGRVASGTPQSH